MYGQIIEDQKHKGFLEEVENPEYSIGQVHYMNLGDVNVKIIHYLNLSDVDVMIIHYLNLSDVDVMIIP
jgi:hypothetical protein